MSHLYFNPTIAMFNEEQEQINDFESFPIKKKKNKRRNNKGEQKSDASIEAVAGYSVGSSVPNSENKSGSSDKNDFQSFPTKKKKKNSENKSGSSDVYIKTLLTQIKNELQELRKTNEVKNMKVEKLETEVVALKKSVDTLIKEKESALKDLKLSQKKLETVASEKNILEKQLLEKDKQIRFELNEITLSIKELKKSSESQKQTITETIKNQMMNMVIGEGLNRGLGCLVNWIKDDGTSEDPIKQLGSEIKKLSDTNRVLVSEINSMKHGNFSQASGIFVENTQHLPKIIGHTSFNNAEDTNSLQTKIDVLNSIMGDLKKKMSTNKSGSQRQMSDSCNYISTVSRQKAPAEKSWGQALAELAVEVGNNFYCDYCQEWGHATQDCPKKRRNLWQ